MERWFKVGSNAIYVIATAALALLALGFLALAGFEVANHVIAGRDPTPGMLKAVGYVVIAIAVFDVAKFLFEEEILRARELRSPIEARRSLTKFITIIVIAISIDGILFVFKAGEENEDLAQLVYPSVLLTVAILLVTGLGAYQRMSQAPEKDERSAAEPNP